MLLAPLAGGSVLKAKSLLSSERATDLERSSRAGAPRHDGSGAFVGLQQEAIFYDPEALVEPVRIIRNLDKQGELLETDPYIYIECLQTIYPIDGIATQTTPGQVIEYIVPEWFNRPWARTWERYFEEGMTPPASEALFGF